MIHDKEQAMTTPTYSTLFTCLYDQPEPLGRIGRGSHHSVFRSVQWYETNGERRQTGRFHDFAVIWDEDHDTRVIPVIERLHLAGLLWPVVFIGERKGVLTILCDYMVIPDLEEEALGYHHRVREIAGGADDTDSWTCEFGWFQRNTGISETSLSETMAIIADSDHRSIPYLEAIDVVWQLGPKRPAATVAWTRVL
ncbi:hypothetical protein ACWGK7_03470 [Sphingomonas aurantiaca]